MLAVVTACGSAPGDGYIARDPCAPLVITMADPAASAVQRDGTTGALALWRGRGVTAFDADPDPADPASAIEVQFAAAASTFHGIYDPGAARVLINRELTDPGAIAIVVAHELGHVFGLGHIAPQARISLMNPGNLATPPTADDQRTLEDRWGRCP